MAAIIAIHEPDFVVICRMLTPLHTERRADHGFSFGNIGAAALALAIVKLRTLTTLEIRGTILKTPSTLQRGVSHNCDCYHPYNLSLRFCCAIYRMPHAFAHQTLRRSGHRR